jgi:hypothetical protein
MSKLNYSNGKSMTYEQKRLVRYWVVAVIFMSIGTYMSLSDIENAQLAILILIIIFTFISVFQDFSYYTGFGDGSERIGEFVADHPYLKYWLVFFCVAVLPFILYRMLTTDNDGNSGALYFLGFFILVGPVFVISERERFLRMGS